jgi:hypothetical protein
MTTRVSWCACWIPLKAVCGPSSIGTMSKMIDNGFSLTSAGTTPPRVTSVRSSTWRPPELVRNISKGLMPTTGATMIANEPVLISAKRVPESIMAKRF